MKVTPEKELSATGLRAADQMTAAELKFLANHMHLRFLKPALLEFSHLWKSGNRFPYWGGDDNG
jgi:hypothetical protein